MYNYLVRNRQHCLSPGTLTLSFCLPVCFPPSPLAQALFMTFLSLTLFHTLSVLSLTLPLSPIHRFVLLIVLPLSIFFGSSSSSHSFRIHCKYSLGMCALMEKTNVLNLTLIASNLIPLVDNLKCVCSALHVLTASLNAELFGSHESLLQFGNPAQDVWHHPEWAEWEWAHK